MGRSAGKSSSGAFHGSRHQVIAIFHSLLAVFSFRSCSKIHFTIFDRKTHPHHRNNASDCCLILIIVSQKTQLFLNLHLLYCLAGNIFTVHFLNKSPTISRKQAQIFTNNIEDELPSEPRSRRQRYQQDEFHLNVLRMFCWFSCSMQNARRSTCSSARRHTAVSELHAYVMTTTTAVIGSMNSTAVVGNFLLNYTIR